MSRLLAITLLLHAHLAHSASPPMNHGKITITSDSTSLRVEFAADGIAQPGRALFVALGTDPLAGCAVVPYQRHSEGSTVFLPFRADRIYAARITAAGTAATWWREWRRGQWSPHMDVKPEFKTTVAPGKITLTVNLSALPRGIIHEQTTAHRITRLPFAAWAKDTLANDGWGALLPEENLRTPPGPGDRHIQSHWHLTGIEDFEEKSESFHAILHPAEYREVKAPRPLPEYRPRPRIYQLLPRLFSNTNETRKPNGTLAENGVGKFNDINDAALRSLREELGITHVWLTGVLAQATSTAYPEIGKPADDPDLLKGLAGSPYAIKDYGDVCPDYAVEPARRMDEFRALVERAHKCGLLVLIDFVPNHIARSHPGIAGNPGACIQSAAKSAHPSPRTSKGSQANAQTSADPEQISSDAPEGHSIISQIATESEQIGQHEAQDTLGIAQASPITAVGSQKPVNDSPKPAGTSPKMRITFGEKDDPSRFFSPANHFFWLQRDTPGGGPPLRLPTVRDGQFVSPTCRVLNAGDGLFLPETETARVTGNNAATWSPGVNDWYETVKLNYGYDFTTGAREYPHAAKPDAPVPDTWLRMDAVLAHWQEMGVNGFRCDMAHMVPPEFWAWAISRARQRAPEVMFVAEAYNNDPMKVEGGYELVAHFKNVMIELLNAGFDAVYDDPAYKTLKRIYDGPAWANDLDAVLAAQEPYVFPHSLRYAENHDEVRLAAKGEWGGIGAEVGRAVSGVLFGISRGPVLLYSGQEVGEPASGAEGFGGDDGRTTIFDYWAMPELAKWVNGHRYDGGRLSPEQRALRAFYGRLLKTCGQPAFRDGEFIPLNGANRDNAEFGRLGEGASGHWLYAFLRADARSGQRFLVVANLHRAETMHGVRVRLGAEALAALGTARRLQFTDRTGGAGTFTREAAEIAAQGIELPPLPPLMASYFEVNDTK